MHRTMHRSEFAGCARVCESALIVCTRCVCVCVHFVRNHYTRSLRAVMMKKYIIEWFVVWWGIRFL